jgi:uncharacterized protein
VNVRGSHRLAAPRDRVFAAIRDPRVLLAVIPGCQGMERTGPDEYDGTIVLRLPGSVGAYRTHVRLTDVVEPEQAGLEGSVEGSMGTIAGRAAFSLRDGDAGGTEIDYEGTGSIGGPLARLDGRFAERFAESLITQGLRALDTRLVTEGSE